MQNAPDRWRHPGRRSIAGGLAMCAVAAASWTSAEAQTLERIRSAGTFKLGYETDARPFSFESEPGEVVGYAVALCTEIVDQVKSELGLVDLAVEWLPQDTGLGIQAVREGSIDLLCGAEPVTLNHRKDVSFSIAIFPSGTGAVVSANSPVALREVLTKGQPSDRPIWRGSPARTVLEEKTFSSIAGTTSETWLAERVKTFQLSASVSPVENYKQGIERILAGNSDVLFGDLPLLLDAATRSEGSGNLIVLDRHFTYEPIALALARGDEDFRLVVDSSLSETFRSEDFREFFTQWFGPPDETIVTFFRQTTLPE